MRKKILIYMFNLAGGGAERTIVNLINNINKEIFEVILIIGSNQNNDYINLVDNRIKIIYLNSDRRKKNILKISKIIRYEKPDILFSTLNINNITIILAKILSLKRVPIVVRETNNRTAAGGVSLINRIITYILYNYFSSNIISLSNGVKEDLVKSFKIKNKKIKVIYNPVDLDKIYKLKNEEILDLKKEENEKLIISVGRLAEQKDYFTLLKAFKIVEKNLKSKLLILGKGPQEQLLKDKCYELNIEEKVVFMGFNDNPYKYMKNSDVFVLSSKWEGFGHVIVEAMATGIPVISTDCKSGPAEIINNNKYGILVPVGDYKKMANEIQNILTNNELAQKYIEKGNYRKEKFNVSSIVKEYEKIFLSLIN